MEKQVNIYAYNQIKAARGDLAGLKAGLMAQLVGIEGALINGSVEMTNVASELLQLLNSYSPELEISRVCFVGLTPFSRRLNVVSSANSPSVGPNQMDVGYNCYVNEESSLFDLKYTDIRICSDIEKVVKNFEREGRPVQRSMSRLYNMGLRSSITMSAYLNPMASGFLFLNSTKPNAFDHFNDSDYMIICTFKLLLKSVLISHFSTLVPNASEDYTFDSKKGRQRNLLSPEALRDELDYTFDHQLSSDVDVSWILGFTDHLRLPVGGLKFLVTELLAYWGRTHELQDVKIRLWLEAREDKQYLYMNVDLSDGARIADAKLWRETAKAMNFELDYTSSGFRLCCEVENAESQDIKTNYSV